MRQNRVKHAETKGQNADTEIPFPKRESMASAARWLSDEDADD